MEILNCLRDRKSNDFLVILDQVFWLEVFSFLNFKRAYFFWSVSKVTKRRKGDSVKSRKEELGKIAGSLVCFLVLFVFLFLFLLLFTFLLLAQLLLLMLHLQLLHFNFNQSIPKFIQHFKSQNAN